MHEPPPAKGRRLCYTAPAVDAPERISWGIFAPQQAACGRVERFFSADL